MGDHLSSDCQGTIARQGEVTAVREKLQELGVQTTDTEPDATIDGGDVLQTRTHIFIGLSRRVVYRCLQEGFGVTSGFGMHL